MTQSSTAIAYLDSERLIRALLAGIHHVVERKEHINRINVFPVPDADTGSNLVYTLKSIRDRLLTFRSDSISELIDTIANAALDGARGNSGAIMAQYFEGFRQGADTSDNRLTAAGLAAAAVAGAESAWGALANPVEGTMPTVLRDFGLAFQEHVAKGQDDIGASFKSALIRAQESLDNTPNQLAALKSAGVVDAGGQGFVDLLDGIATYIKTGEMPQDQRDSEEESQAAFLPNHDLSDAEHRFCTECMVIGENINRQALSETLQALDSSSLVIAGSSSRVRVHIHVDSPAQVFLACEDYGDVTRQKADDIFKQQAMLQHSGQVAIVTDSASDMPEDEIERLNIHTVPLRLMFDDQDYLDKVSITPLEFYDKLAASDVFPKTSQPPAGDFARQFELLSSHGHDVISINVSRNLSGTLQAAELAAQRFATGKVQVVDSYNGAAGQGLLTLYAAQAASEGMNVQDVLTVTRAMVRETRTFALVRDLSWGVRGGRVPAWGQKLANWFLLNPVLSSSPQGTLVIRGVVLGRKRLAQRFARHVARRLKENEIYRVLIGHANARDNAKEIKHELLARHPQVHSCMIVDTSPAVGVHLGPGGMVIGVQRWVPPQEMLAEINGRDND